MSDPISFITTESIFERYHLPQLLQTHLWRTASLMELLLKHWRGPQVDASLLIETMLLHDLGNLVKFDLSDTTPIMLLTQTELPMYRALQAEWHQKYGKVVDAVTVAFIKELRLKNGPIMSHIILNHASGTEATTVTQDDWIQKLCDYTDFRIAPHGLVTLKERFDDLGKRYATRASGWETAAKVAQKLNFFTTIETQLQAQIKLDLTQITAADLEPLSRLKTHRFEVIPE
jgi:hypothetical protein